MPATTTETSTDALVARVAQLEAQLSAERTASQALVDKLQKDVELLRASHERLRQELEMLRHRIFVAKAERIDSKQLELEFASKLAALDELARQIPPQPPATGAAGGSSSAGAGDRREDNKPSGRRDLRGLKIPEVRIEITDPVFEALVDEGKAARGDFEESCKLAWQRGGQRRLVIARAKYKTLGDDPMLETAAVPEEILPRALAAPSMLGHIVHEKLGRGMPLYRLETGFRRDGVPIDRGTMSRWLEELGGTVGSTIIEAARLEAMAKAFCILDRRHRHRYLARAQPREEAPGLPPRSPSSSRSPIGTTSSSSTPPRRRASRWPRCSGASPATSRPTPRASSTSFSVRRPTDADDTPQARG